MFPDNQVDIYASIDSEVSDLLDHARRAVDVDDSLVNAHFEPVPSLGTLTARTLSRGDPQNLGRNADRALGLVALVLGSGDDFSAGALQRFHFFASQGHSKERNEGSHTQIEGPRMSKKKKSGLPDSLDFFMDFLSLGLFLFDICHVDYDFNLL